MKEIGQMSEETKEKKKRKKDCLINDELIVDIQILQLIQKKLKIHLFSWNLLSNS